MSLDLNFLPFSGSGIASIYPRATDGTLSGGFDLGEAPVFKLSKNVPVAEMNTSRDTSRGVAYRMAQSKAASLEIQLKTLSDANLQMLHSGVWTDVAAGGGPVTGWVAPSSLVVNQMIKLPARNVSAVVVKDSTAGTPKTLAATQYTLDPVGGTIKLLDITTGGAYVQPFKVDYTAGAVSVLGALKAVDQEYLVQLDGTNAYNGQRVIFEGFKFRFSADGDSDFISESYGTWTLKGSLLVDSTRQASSAGGQYYALSKLVTP